MAQQEVVLWGGFQFFYGGVVVNGEEVVVELQLCSVCGGHFCML